MTLLWATGAFYGGKLACSVEPPGGLRPRVRATEEAYERKSGHGFARLQADKNARYRCGPGRRAPKASKKRQAWPFRPPGLSVAYHLE